VTEFIQPQLTSIEQHPEEMGRQACRRLLNYLEQAELPLPRGETIHIPVTLVKRDSCARAQRECR
jgi:DNA-binding LacI/PurR family transcriptional regulator